MIWRARRASGSEQKITAALNRARRPNLVEDATAIQAAPRAEQLGQSAVVTDAYAATVRAQVAILTALNSEINTPWRSRSRRIWQAPGR